MEGSFAPNISCDGRRRWRRIADRRLSSRTSGAKAQVADETLAPNAFVRIKPDDSITLVMPQVEMGQGTYTSMSMLIAEELEVDLAKVGLEAAPPSDKLYANPLLGFQVTGGSTSVMGFWEPLRRAGATARVMLIQAAAAQWNVGPASCRAEKGEVVSPTGESSIMALSPRLRRNCRFRTRSRSRIRRTFTLIGTPAKRLDTPEKVNGKAKYGIDAMLPGMKFAAVSACPVFGGKLKSVDDSKAMAIKGVRQLVKIDNAVAVVGDHMWAANKGSVLSRSNGTTARTRMSQRRASYSRWRAPRRTTASLPETTVTLPRQFRAPPKRSRRSMSCRSSPTPPWSR